MLGTARHRIPNGSKDIRQMKTPQITSLALALTLGLAVPLFAQETTETPAPEAPAVAGDAAGGDGLSMGAEIGAPAAAGDTYVAATFDAWEQRCIKHRPWRRPLPALPAAEGRSGQFRCRILDLLAARGVARPRRGRRDLHRAAGNASDRGSDGADRYQQGARPIRSPSAPRSAASPVSALPRTKWPSSRRAPMPR